MANQVDVRLDVERTGEPEAIEQAAEELQQLEPAAESASTGLGKVAEESERTEEKASGLKGEIEGLAAGFLGVDEAIAGLDFSDLDGLPAKVQAVTAAWDVFRTSYEGTRELIDQVEERFGISIDNMVSDVLRLEDLADRVVNAGRDAAAEQSELFENVANVLSGKGIEVSPVLAENLERLAEAGKQAGGLEENLEPARAALKKLGVDVEGTKERAAEFLEQWEGITKLPSFESEGVTEALRSEVQRLISDLTRLGQQVPEKLQIIAESLGALPDSLPEDGGGLSAKVEAYLSSIPGALDAAAEQIQDKQEVIRDALASLAPEGDFSFLPPEAVEKVKADLDQVFSAIEASGGQIDQQLATQAQSLGVVVESYGQAGLGASKSIKVIEQGLDSLGKKTFKTKTITAEAARAMTFEELSQASPRIQEYRKALDEADKGLAETEKGAKGAGEALKEPSKQAGEAGSKVKELAKGGKELAAAQEEVSSTAASAASGIKGITTAAKDASAIDELKSKLEELGRVNFASSIVSQMGEISTAAKTALADVQAVVQAAGAGG